ncbi:hypothetical protein RUND412_002037 [Rhizina undulata]
MYSHHRNPPPSQKTPPLNPTPTFPAFDFAASDLKDCRQYPLIRDVLQANPFPMTHGPPNDESHDEDVSAWLSIPGVVSAIRAHVPPDFAASDEKLYVDENGDLLYWGEKVEGAVWGNCVRVRGLEWRSARMDMRDLFADHDIIASPLVVGSASDFAAIVYLSSAEACARAIDDLDWALIERSAILKVFKVSQEDLQAVRKFQNQMEHNI